MAKKLVPIAISLDPDQLMGLVAAQNTGLVAALNTPLGMALLDDLGAQVEQPNLREDLIAVAQADLAKLEAARQALKAKIPA